MRRSGLLGLAISAVAITTGVIGAGTAFADTRTIISGGTAAFAPRPSADVGAPQAQEFPQLERNDGVPFVNRQHKGKKLFPREKLDAPNVASAAVAPVNPELGLSFNGLHFRDQRTANGGNQFSVEPPDQGLCVGGPYVLEVVNSVMRVYSKAGAPLSGTQDLNSFYGYPAQINRTTHEQGPFIADPVCYYDPENARFVVTVLTLEVVPTTGAFTGPNHLDVAVSNTPDPRGSWSIYRIPVQDDGTQGTPSHRNCPCIGDYPHIGADANGVYLTTNEYSLFGNGYNGAQVYALPKSELYSGGMSIDVTQVENLSVHGSPGFTVWPATSNPGDYATDAGGTEYFLSTVAGDGSETGNPTGTANKLVLWALTNTSSLNAGKKVKLRIDSAVLDSQTYVFPPLANQKPGDFPLGQCINDTTSPTPFGPGCWRYLFTKEPAHDEVLSSPSANDTREQQVWYRGGRLYGAADTGVNVGDSGKAAIIWWVVEPSVKKEGKTSGSVLNQGYLALAGNNLTYPAFAVGANGKGVLAFSVLGDDYWPSAGYATFDSATGAVGPIHIAATGAGPDDGFTGYKALVANPSTRWGDYGAAVTDGTDIWIGSEYIGQTCTLAQYMSPPFGSCGGTRAALGNWYTRISKVTP